jgi:nicotinate-nucleotide adenylyltransferase
MSAGRSVPELPPPGLASRRIGLLGGSFNPAHAGHVHISRLALDRLGLDEVWWLVSPQNPLKPALGMAPLEARLAAARAIARDPRIRVTDVERRLATRYTVDTVLALRQAWPEARFVWLMGADILIQLPRWRRWKRLMRRVPVAVFARAPYSAKALAGRAAARFKAARKAPSRARRLAMLRPPAWTFLRIPLHPASASAIRMRGGNPKLRGSV